MGRFEDEEVVLVLAAAIVEDEEEAVLEGVTAVLLEPEEEVKVVDEDFCPAAAASTDDDAAVAELFPLKDTLLLFSLLCLLLFSKVNFEVNPCSKDIPLRVELVSSRGAATFRRSFLHLDWHFSCLQH